MPRLREAEALTTHNYISMSNFSLFLRLLLRFSETP
nr:MAG TPA: hypothetical protein [Inoviridae sp.]